MNRARLCVAVCFFLCLWGPASGAIEIPDGDWVRLEVSGITVFTDGKESTAIEFARQLGQLKRSLRMYTMIQGGQEREIRLYVFRNDESFTPYKPLYKGKPANVAGYTTQSSDTISMAIQSRDFRNPGEVLFHEFVHAFLAEKAPRTPLWLNEGLAEFYSNFRPDGDHVYIGEPVSYHVDFLREKRHYLSMARILMMDQEDPEYNEGRRQGLFYAQSWATTHYLLTGKERRKALLQFLRDIHDGVPEMAAVSRNLDGQLPAQNQELRDYVTQRKLPHFKLRNKGDEDADRPVRAEIDDTTLLLYLGQLASTLGEENAPSARAHFDECLARDPSRSRARLGLALIRMRADDLDGAIEELDHAEELDPDDASVQGLLGYAMILRHQKEAGADAWTRGTAIPEAVLEARDHLRRAMQDDRPQPWTRYAFALSYAAAEDPAPGIEALVEATGATPWHTDLFLLLVRLLCEADQLDEARRVYNEELRPRTRVTERHNIEVMLVNAEILASDRLRQDGNNDAAFLLLARALAGTDSRTMHTLVLRQMDRLQLSATYVDYAEVLELVSTRKYEEALSSLDALAPDIKQPQLIEQAAELREMLVALVEG